MNQRPRFGTSPSRPFACRSFGGSGARVSKRRWAVFRPNSRLVILRGRRSRISPPEQSIPDPELRRWPQGGAGFANDSGSSQLLIWIASLSDAFQLRLATSADVDLSSWHRARMFQDMGELPLVVFLFFPHKC